jgi:hypothetical protein
MPACSRFHEEAECPARIACSPVPMTRTAILLRAVPIMAALTAFAALSLSALIQINHQA